MRRPMIIAHRGASGERPEHTMAAYERAVALGADAIEPDLVMTRDGLLVARHENKISGTTDVAERAEYADRRTTKTIDGGPLPGWFAEDFTLAELKTLRARERLPEWRPGSAAFRDEPILTIEEIVDFAKARGIGLVLEIKHSSYSASIGLPIEPALLRLLDRAGWSRRDAPVWIESFETGNLRRLRKETNVRLVQLLESHGHPADGGPSYAEMATPAGLAEIATYADAIGPAKALIVPRDADGRSLAPTRLVADAHAAGLQVFPWTFRSENAFLPAELRIGTDHSTHGRADEEYRQFIALGVDALFSDFPGEAVRVRNG